MSARFLKSGNGALLFLESANESAALTFGKERNVSSAHKIYERITVNIIFPKESRTYFNFLEF